AVCLAAIAILSIVAFFLPKAGHDFFVSEGGPVQILSAAGYVMVVIALWRETGAAYMWRHFYFAVVPVAMCLRELDFHVHFTAMSITKTSFYASSTVPLAAKVLVLILFGILGWAIVLMLVRHLAGFLADLRLRQTYAIAIAFAALLT